MQSRLEMLRSSALLWVGLAACEPTVSFHPDARSPELGYVVDSGVALADAGRPGLDAAPYADARASEDAAAPDASSAPEDAATAADDAAPRSCGTEPPTEVAWALAVEPSEDCPESAYVQRPDQPYGPGGRQKIDVYVPVGLVAPAPTLLYLHGGAWLSGARAPIPRFAARALCRGWAVVAIGYRLSDRARFPAQIHDAKAAVRLARARAAEWGLDPRRFVAFGTSAGGHLAALLGTSGDVPELEDPSMGNAAESSRVQGVIDAFGPTDFLQMDRQAAGCGSSSHDDPGSPESRLVGCAIQSCPARAEAANPIRYVTPDDPPFFLLHGGADCTVHWRQSQLLHDALRCVGVSSTFWLSPRRGHAGTAWSEPEVLERMDGFLALF